MTARSTGPYCTGWEASGGAVPVVATPQAQVRVITRCSVTCTLIGGRSNTCRTLHPLWGAPARSVPHPLHCDGSCRITMSGSGTWVRVIRHDPSQCKGCGTDLAGAPQSGCSVRQVFDLPPIRVQVTEHRVITRTCACGVATTGTAPPLASHPVQYGPVLRAVMVYLFMGQHLS